VWLPVGKYSSEKAANQKPSHEQHLSDISQLMSITNEIPLKKKMNVTLQFTVGFESTQAYDFSVLQY